MLLLCGYQLDVFDRETQVGVLPGICRTHSHVQPAADLERMQRAVDAAIDDELGDRAAQLYAMVGDQIRQRRVPAAQLALMWVSANMPMVAERVLAVRRTRAASARALLLADRARAADPADGRENRGSEPIRTP